MPDRIFYAAAEDQKPPHRITGYVPSKFLVRDGAYVVDPIPGTSQKANLYSDSLGNEQTDGRIANPNNYVVVPANYDAQQARDFGARLAAAQRISPIAALTMMAYGFRDDGSEDLQRNPQWGIPPNSFVRAYTSAASDHFGNVTASAGVPRELAESGGAMHNWLSWARSKAASVLGSSDVHPIDIEGKYGLSKVNEANIAQGYAAGLAANRPPAPFNDYGYNPQPQAAAGQIGDGNGISPFPAMLHGINPDEAAPPEWPPQQSSPVRYLSSKFAELNEARRNGR